MKKIINITIPIILVSTLILFTYFFIYNDKKIENKPKPNTPDIKTNSIKIIAVGDSLTAGYGLPFKESYPKQLEKKLLENGYNIEIINAGISGETTAGLLERLDFIKKQEPKIVLITIGGNDALRALPIEETENNILKIVKGFKEILPGNKIFLMNIQSPGNLGINYTKKFNNIYKKISNSENINLIPFVTAEIFTNQNLMQNDGIHPNAKGYELLINKYIYQSIEKEIKN